MYYSVQKLVRMSLALVLLCCGVLGVSKTFSDHAANTQLLAEDGPKPNGGG